ncbi:response regulator transcription factor [Labrys wisconsinensis]|uniref:FixJ family two-component response regulator n=1 Tax=Labrys wisconsinensis TaxID=425677 RepID=A0ABU0J8A3_9HYPH|nr:response regulator [Labrys wisconsinensis]MDQ0469830.1 FixJ family two-component response regulator [Labrys wisconsinensis]
MTAKLGPILVVDDDSAVRQALRFALEMEGLRVQLYEGPAAILGAKDLPATGCLVVDYSMPAMNGIELVDALRGRSVGLPAILIASRVSNDMRARAARSGIRKVLEKPLTDGALVETIRSALVTAPG